jgi:hypothetical protein
VRTLLEDAAQRGDASLSGRGGRLVELKPSILHAFDRFVTAAMSGHDLLYKRRASGWRMSGGRTPDRRLRFRGVYAEGLPLFHIGTRSGRRIARKKFQALSCVLWIFPQTRLYQSVKSQNSFRLNYYRSKSATSTMG